MNCAACGKTLPVSSFSKKQQNKDDSRCKTCILENRGNILCCSCRKSFSKHQFSKNQMKKSVRKRRCRNCINNIVHEDDPHSESASEYENDSENEYSSDDSENIRCCSCRKSFSQNQFSKRQQKKSANKRKCINCTNARSRDSLPIPFAGIEGEWVAREEFPGRKSFAFYQCSTCHKWWMSSRGFTDYGQQCKESKCTNRYQMAKYMWMNKTGKKRDDDKHLEDKKIAHMKEYCEACQAGDCNW